MVVATLALAGAAALGLRSSRQRERSHRRIGLFGKISGTGSKCGTRKWFDEDRDRVALLRMQVHIGAKTSDLRVSQLEGQLFVFLGAGGKTLELLDNVMSSKFIHLANFEWCPFPALSAC